MNPSRAMRRGKHHIHIKTLGSWRNTDAPACEDYSFKMVHTGSEDQTECKFYYIVDAWCSRCSDDSSTHRCCCDYPSPQPPTHTHTLIGLKRKNSMYAMASLTCYYKKCESSCTFYLFIAVCELTYFRSDSFKLLDVYTCGPCQGICS